MGIVDRIKHAWNAWTDWDQNYQQSHGWGGSAFSIRPDRTRLSFTNERSIITSILNRMSVDASKIELSHIKNDEDGKYVKDMPSFLNDCLKVEANIDQAASQFRRDVYMTMFDKGVVAIVPVDTTSSPINSNAYDVMSMRVGEVVAWQADTVRVRVYNEKLGVRQEITLPKSLVAIAENPFYEVMNEPSSTLQRLTHKLNLLDQVDEASSSGKLDLIIQLPYVIKTESRRQQADQRRKDIELQLKGSKYGIAYTDGTEKITQLNRPAENNLLAQVEYLTGLLFSQLGLTDTIMNGTADEKTMLNYYNRVIDPIVTAVVEAMIRTFLSKTARTQGQTITTFRDPFELTDLESFSKMTDVIMRNTIGTANEVRAVIGWKPHKDPKADQLVNSNMPVQSQLTPPGVNPQLPPRPTALPQRQQLQLTRTGGNSQNGSGSS